MSRHICPQRGVSRQSAAGFFTFYTLGSTDSTDIRLKDTSLTYPRSPAFLDVIKVARWRPSVNIMTGVWCVVVMFSVPAMFRLSEISLRMSQSDAKLE